MKLKSKFWMISFICLGAGILLLIVGALCGGKPGFYIDKTGIHTMGEPSWQDVTQKKEKLEEFNDIEMYLDDADLEIIPSDGYYIEYNLPGGMGKPSYGVTDKTLNFSGEYQDGNWIISFLNFDTEAFSKSYAVKLYVPRDAKLGSIQITQDSGDITLPELQAKSVKILNGDGDIRFKDIKAENIELQASSGDISGGELAANTVQINNGDGDVKLAGVQAKSVLAKLSNGDLKADMMAADQMDIESEYGDVKLRMAESLEDYSLNIRVEYGDLTIPGYTVLTDEDGDEMFCQTEKKSEKELRINSENGDVNVISR